MLDCEFWVREKYFCNKWNLTFLRLAVILSCMMRITNWSKHIFLCCWCLVRRESRGSRQATEWNERGAESSSVSSVPWEKYLLIFVLDETRISIAHRISMQNYNQDFQWIFTSHSARLAADFRSTNISFFDFIPRIVSQIFPLSVSSPIPRTALLGDDFNFNEHNISFERKQVSEDTFKVSVHLLFPHSWLLSWFIQPAQRRWTFAWKWGNLGDLISWKTHRISRIRVKPWVDLSRNFLLQFPIV